jgi:hypothetical protein
MGSDHAVLVKRWRVFKIDPERRNAVSISGEMEYDAVAERQAMFDHVWLTNKVLYVKIFTALIGT